MASHSTEHPGKPLGNEENIAEQFSIVSDKFTEICPNTPLQCQLCDGEATSKDPLMAFFCQRDISSHVVVHRYCAQFSSGVQVLSGSWGLGRGQFRSVVDAVHRARHCGCYLCGKSGASVTCASPTCSVSYHVRCSEKTGWAFGPCTLFHCHNHRERTDHLQNTLGKKEVIKHNLLLSNTYPNCRSPPASINNNKANTLFSLEGQLNDDGKCQINCELEEEHTLREIRGEGQRDCVNKAKEENFTQDPHLNCFIAENYTVRTEVAAKRPTLKDHWNIQVMLREGSCTRILLVATHQKTDVNGLRAGDIICMVNGIRIGTVGLLNMIEFLAFVTTKLELRIEILRKPDSWTGAVSQRSISFGNDRVGA